MKGIGKTWGRNSAVEDEKAEEKNCGGLNGLPTGMPDEPGCRLPSPRGRTPGTAHFLAVQDPRTENEAGKEKNKGRRRKLLDARFVIKIVIRDSSDRQGAQGPSSAIPKPILANENATQ